jgi:hypothetical protein
VKDTTGIMLNGEKFETKDITLKRKSIRKRDKADRGIESNRKRERERQDR